MGGIRNDGQIHQDCGHASVDIKDFHIIGDMGKNVTV